MSTQALQQAKEALTQAIRDLEYAVPIVVQHNETRATSISIKLNGYRSALAALATVSSDAQPVAYANWKVGSKSYVPFRTREEAEASVLRSEVSATQNGPYAVAELYASLAPDVRPSVLSDEPVRDLMFAIFDNRKAAFEFYKFAPDHVGEDRDAARLATIKADDGLREKVRALLAGQPSAPVQPQDEDAISAARWFIGAGFESGHMVSQEAADDLLKQFNNAVSHPTQDKPQEAGLSHSRFGSPDMQALILQNLEARAAPAVPERLREIGRLLLTQDNRITDAPLFIVEQRREIIGIDPNYADDSQVKICWLNEEGSRITDPDHHAQLEREYEGTAREPECYTRTAYSQEWEFVTACFTEQGCKDYLRINGHNLKESRIYANGSCRNEEYRFVREWLMSIAAARATPSVSADPLQELADQAQDLDMGYGPNACPTCGKSVPSVSADTKKVELPPLPEPWIRDLNAPAGSQDHFAADQMQDYARAAIAQAAPAVPDVAVIANIRKYAEELNAEAIADGFAGSDTAYKLFDLLGAAAPSAPSVGANAEDGFLSAAEAFAKAHIECDEMESRDVLDAMGNDIVSDREYKTKTAAYNSTKAAMLNTYRAAIAAQSKSQQPAQADKDRP